MCVCLHKEHAHAHVDVFFPISILILSLAIFHLYLVRTINYRQSDRRLKFKIRHSSIKGSDHRFRQSYPVSKAFSSPVPSKGTVVTSGWQKGYFDCLSSATVGPLSFHLTAWAQVHVGVMRPTVMHGTAGSRGCECFGGHVGP